MGVVLAILIAFAPAGATEPAMSPEALRAEGVRLSQEIQRANAKSAWPAVERHYVGAVATGAPLSIGIHLIGAASARNRGDLGSMQARLFAVLQLDPEHREARATLEDLDKRYAKVQLMSPLGAKLEGYDHHFDPGALKAIEFAAQHLSDTGAFHGRLPPGPYTIDGDPFEAVLGREVIFDLSLPPPPPPPPQPRPFRRSR